MNQSRKAAVPKSKVRKKSDYIAPSRSAGATAVKQSAPSPQWYPYVMGALLVIGLLWIATYYIAGERFALMVSLGGWNFAIGFAFLIAGLLLAVRWR